MQEQIFKMCLKHGHTFRKTATESRQTDKNTHQNTDKQTYRERDPQVARAGMQQFFLDEKTTFKAKSENNFFWRIKNEKIKTSFSLQNNFQNMNVNQFYWH